MPSNTLTRDEALLALNDHCGHKVEAIVETEVIRDEYETKSLVMSANGQLDHWRHAPGSEVFRPWSREDITGVYQVGAASIDITDFHEARLLTVEERDYGLAFDLAEGVVLTVEWGIDQSGTG